MQVLLSHFKHLPDFLINSNFWWSVPAFHKFFWFLILCALFQESLLNTCADWNNIFLLTARVCLVSRSCYLLNIDYHIAPVLSIYYLIFLLITFNCLIWAKYSVYYCVCLFCIHAWALCSICLAVLSWSSVICLPLFLCSSPSCAVLFCSVKTIKSN